MYNVSNAFKTAIKQPIKEVDAYVAYEVVNGQTTETRTITAADDLLSVKIEGENGVGKAVLKKVEIKALGHYIQLLNETVNIYVGVKAQSEYTTENGFEYINYGTFIITEVEISEDKGYTTCKGYDLMILANQDYEEVGLEYPCTVYAFTNAVCNKCGISLGSDSWPNSTVELASDRYVGIQGTQYRDVINDVAAASGTIAMIKNDQLFFDFPGETNEILTYEELKTLKFLPKHGPINSVVLARAPQEDNIVVKDDASITLNGLTEYRVENIQLIDDQREAFAQAIANQVFGFEYYPFEVKTIGLAYLEIGDIITFESENGNYSTYISSFSLSLDGGISEALKSSKIEQANTDYSRAGGLNKKLNKAELIVNKQLGEISGVISSYDERVGDLETNLSLTSEALSGRIDDLKRDVDGNWIKVTGMIDYKNIAPEGQNPVFALVLGESDETMITYITNAEAAFTTDGDIDDAKAWIGLLGLGTLTLFVGDKETQGNQWRHEVIGGEGDDGLFYAIHRHTGDE